MEIQVAIDRDLDMQEDLGEALENSEGNGLHFIQRFLYIYIPIFEKKKKIVIEQRRKNRKVVVKYI